jgi:hypothetical protein
VKKTKSSDESPQKKAEIYTTTTDQLKEDKNSPAPTRVPAD